MRIFIPVLIIALLSPAGIHAQTTASTDSTSLQVSRPDSMNLLIPLPFFSKVGFQSGLVRTDMFDTGVDFGALLSKDIYHDFLEFTSAVHLWGATNDTLDVATAGIDAQMLYKIPVRWGFFCFGGFIVGFNYVHKEKTVTVNGNPVTTRESKATVDRFITAGAEYDLKANRTLFFQIKYGETSLTRETHFIMGLNFYTKYKKFIPWLAPPLMRD